MNPNYLYDLARQQPLRSDLFDPEGVPQTLSGLIAMENARLYAPSQFNFTPQMAQGFDQQAARGQADLAKWAEQVEKNRMERQKFNLQMAQFQKGPDPYFSPIQTAQGVFSFNARTGKMEPVQVGGQNVVGAAADPNLQGKIAGAKQKGESEAKREFNMGGVGGIIGEADRILREGKATSSVIGRGVDIAGSIIGASPKGAAEADQLKVLGGYLVSKMPRMEGPQSNYDVQNYKEMAADIGNPTLPLERRIAALDTLKGIVSKYDQSAPVMPETPKKQNANLSSQDMQALDWAMKNKADPRAQQIMQKLGIR
jgi:hypothetical protein